MITSSIRRLILIFFFALGVENLVFSFRSQYDGYIYPKWKKKGKVIERFYEDAVVVGKDFMVLGDGLGRTNGFSGIYSIHQCLSIAEKLETNTFKTVEEVDVKVKAALKESNKSLGFSHLNYEMRDVATTLVYMKLSGDNLLTGVIGDSGFSIYRYYKDEGIMKLENRSKETVYNFNGPHYVSPDESNDADKKEYEVLEGDIVMVGSDGLLDVLPSSFLTAATNYLVAKMIEKKRQREDLKQMNPKYDLENDLNYDYDFDLAYFLEGYVQNVRELTQKFKDYILERQSKLNKLDLSFFSRHSQAKPIVQPFSQNFNIDPADVDPAKNSKSKNINLFHQNPQQHNFETDSSAMKYQIPDDHPTQLGKREIIFKNPKFDRTIRQSQQDQNNKNSSGQFNNQQPVPKSSAYKSQYENSPIKNLSSDESDINDLEHNEFEEKTTEVNKPYQDFNVNKFQNTIELSNDQIKLKKMINDAMEKIYTHEICNVFDPIDDSMIFKILDKNIEFENLTQFNVKHKKQRYNHQIDCFRNKKIAKITNYDRPPIKWNCKDILDLTYPIHPTKNDKGSLHNFHECVEKSIPKLPDNVTPKEIAEAFNSRYFARNIALAVKYVTNDPWVKADNYLLKKLFDNNLNKVDLSDRNLKDFKTKNWVAKDDDVSIAAAAILSQDNFDVTNPQINDNPFFMRGLSKHSSAVEKTFKYFTNEAAQKIKI